MASPWNRGMPLEVIRQLERALLGGEFFWRLMKHFTLTGGTNPKKTEVVEVSH